MSFKNILYILLVSITEVMLYSCTTAKATSVEYKYSKVNNNQQQWCTVNGRVYYFSGAKGDDISHLINAKFKEESYLVIELNSGVSYDIREPIILPTHANQFLSIIGNHARMVSWIEKDEYTFNALINPDLTTTGQADKEYQFKDIHLRGNGSGFFLQGSYKSSFSGIKITNMLKGIHAEFALQCVIDNTQVNFRETGIYLGIIKTGYNSTQSNLSTVTDVRCLAARPHPSNPVIAKEALVISNSNLVKVDGFISEGWSVEKGIHLLNTNTTVTSARLTRCHFENFSYTDAVVFSEGRWLPLLIIDEIYYAPDRNRISTFLKTSYTNGYSVVRFSNISSYGYWRIDINPDSRGLGINTRFYFDGVPKQLPKEDVFENMFIGVKPEHFWINGAERLTVTR